MRIPALELRLFQDNCLATCYPELAKQWHPELNGNLTPNDVIAGSNKKFWWKCPVADDHRWEASLDNRTCNNSRCPHCVNDSLGELRIEEILKQGEDYFQEFSERAADILNLIDLAWSEL